MWAYTVPNQYTPSFRERALKVMTSLPFPLIRLVAHSHSTLLAIPLHKFIVFAESKSASARMCANEMERGNTFKVLTFSFQSFNIYKVHICMFVCLLY